MATSEQYILEANKKYAHQYKTGVIPIGPARKTVIVTCMDSRLDPAAAYGLNLGEVTIIRNAGASARDASRSVFLSSHILGAEQVFIIKHTHCGMLGGDTEMVHTMMKRNLEVNESKEVDDFEVLPIANLTESAREDVAYLRNHALTLPNLRITGWIHDIENGILEKVVE